MLSEEEISKAIETPTTQIVKTTKTFHGVAIKDRTDIDHRVVDHNTITKSMEINKTMIINRLSRKVI